MKSDFDPVNIIMNKKEKANDIVNRKIDAPLVETPAQSVVEKPQQKTRTKRKLSS